MIHKKNNLLSDSTVLYQELQDECNAMVKHVLRAGKLINQDYILILDELVKKDSSQHNYVLLMQLHNYLTNLIKPANPQAILLLEPKKQAQNIFFGPLPIVRHFMFLAIFSLTAMVCLSLSRYINNETIVLSMLQGYGLSQVLRFSFLISCASVGACFYALFKMNNYIADGTFKVSLSFTYWARYVLGIVAGLLLSELLATLIEPNKIKELGNTSYLLKPILAILGGFSANLVYQILNRLVETVESLFKTELKEVMKQHKQVMHMEAATESLKLKGEIALQLIKLRQTIAQKAPSSESIQHIDTLISQFFSQDRAPKTLNHSSTVVNPNK